MEGRAHTEQWSTCRTKGVLDPATLKRRIHAARLLRDMEQVELDKLCYEDGLGKGEAGRTERGELPLTRVRREAFARHLRVPEEWFTEEDADLLVFPADHRLEEEAEILESQREALKRLEELAVTLLEIEQRRERSARTRTPEGSARVERARAARS